MESEISDDLIARVRAYLAGLEPPVRADDLSDEEVAGLVMEAIGCLQDWVIHGLLPERFRPPTPLPPLPPILMDINREGLTARVGPMTRHTRALELGTYPNYEEARRDHFRRALEETARTIRDNLTGRVLSGPTPSESPLPPR